MKKRVRLYKAQMGGFQAAQEVAAAQNQVQITDDQLMEAVVDLMSKGDSSDDAFEKLIASGIDQQRAQNIIDTVTASIDDEEEERVAKIKQDDERLEELALQEQSDAEDIAAAEREAQKERYQQMYYSGNDDDDGAMDEEEMMSDMIMRYGGKVPSKRTFVKNVMKLTKKQLGGEETKDKNVADGTDTGQRGQGLQSFVGSLQGHANNALMKEDAERMYNQYFQDGGDTESGIMNFDPYHNLAHYSDTFEHAMPQDMTSMMKAQDGGANLSPRQQRQMQRQNNRMMKQTNRVVRNIPAAYSGYGSGMFPQGINILNIAQPRMMGAANASPLSNYMGGVRMANIDVRRTGIFGRPKEYTINFASDVAMNPQLQKELMEQEARNMRQTVKDVTDAGYKTVTTYSGTSSASSSTKPSATVPTEGQVTDFFKKDEDKDKLPDYLEVNETSTATTTPEGEASSTTATANTSSSSAGSRNTSSNSGKASRPKGNSNSGSNSRNEEVVESEEIDVPPANKNLINASAINYLINPLIKRDKWGRKPNDPWYSFDPKKKVFTKYIQPSDPRHTRMTPAQRNYNTKLNVLQSMGYQEGGMISNPFQDPYGNLQKFIYGGGDDISIPQVAGKLTDDAYFAYGGINKFDDGGPFVRPSSYEAYQSKTGWARGSMTPEEKAYEEEWLQNYYYPKNKVKSGAIEESKSKETNTQGSTTSNKTTTTAKSSTTTPKSTTTNTTVVPGYGAPIYPPLFGGGRGIRGLLGANALAANPFIQRARSWTQQQGLPYDPKTGKTMDISSMGNAPLSRIDVKKSRMLSGRPKEYTMYFGPQSDPTAPLITMPGEGKAGEAKSGTKAGTSKQSAATQQSAQTVESEGKRRMAPGLEKALLKIPGMSRVLYPYGDEREFVGEGPATPEGVPFEQAIADVGYPQEETSFNPGQGVDFATGEFPEINERNSAYGFQPGAGVDFATGEFPEMQGNPMLNNLPYAPLRNPGYLNTGLGQQQLVPQNYGYTPENAAALMNFIPENFMQMQQRGYARGGALPRAQIGMGNVYTQNPDMVGLSDIDLLNTETAPIANVPSSMSSWQNPAGSNMPIRPNQEKDPTMLEIDPTQFNRQTAIKEKGFAADFKDKNMFNINPEQGVNLFNKFANMGLQGLENREARKQEKENYKQLIGDNLYGSTNIMSRGTYNVNSGLLDESTMGSVGVVKYGGNIYQDGGYIYDEDEYAEGGETWMSEDQINRFLAEGGELEFI
jgi:hypothetical protein